MLLAELCLQVIPKLRLNALVERVTIRTEVNWTISVVHDNNSHFRLGPSLCEDDFLLPHILISELHILPDWHVDMSVDVVKLPSSPHLYAFKRVHPAQYLLRTCDDDSTEPLLEQAKFLAQIDSPFIIKATALVIDTRREFRGYIMPYCPARSLSYIFSTRRPDHCTVLEPLHTSHSSSVSQSPSVQDSHSGSVARLNWSLKHAWAIDIVSGIATLHDLGLYWRDVKLENILLCKDGQCRLIDVPSGGEYTLLYAPPEYSVVSDTPFTPLPSFPMTAPQTIFPLGLVLWALSEEIGRFERSDNYVRPCLIWDDGCVGSAPIWYRELTESCLAEAADDRPTAQTVLKALIGRYTVD